MSHLEAFRNEPVLELRRAAVRAQLAPALAEVDARLPLRVPVRIGGDERHGEKLVSTDPCAPSRVVAVAASATPDEADAAVRAVREGGRRWAARPASERAAALRRAADVLRRRRLEAAALMVRECAKPWLEADADVCEAVDFLEFYAAGAEALAAGSPVTSVPGERNALRYVARGVAAVIAPWNFPLAIPCGMTAAALAVGNGVVLKPAEQSPGCALLLADALREGGVPDDAFCLLPGEGEAGAALVEHPLVHVVAFTGSMDVGLRIVAAAAEPREGQHHVKTVVAEMGGKNAVVVAADADLDDAVPAIVGSAFGYAGQKCSAASRVLVEEVVAERLLERLAGAVATLRVGPADDLATDVPAVIERSAQERIDGYAAIARSDGRVVAGDDLALPGGEGWWCAPLVVADLPAASPVVEEEIFGPLLAVEAVASLDAAFGALEASPYALTAGLFTRDPRVVDEAVRRVPAGNLYVNRGTTGAKVARQPFGGNRLSGTGTKAGGFDYLERFCEPRAVTEDVTRHGVVVG